MQRQDGHRGVQMSSGRNNGLVRRQQTQARARHSTHLARLELRPFPTEASAHVRPLRLELHGKHLQRSQPPLLHAVLELFEAAKGGARSPEAQPCRVGQIT